MTPDNTAAKPLLFTPFTMKGVTAKNRIVVSPMSQYVAEDAQPGDWHLAHLGKFAMGGAGIVFCEETAVTRECLKTYHCPGIFNESQVKAWRRVTDFLKSCGSVPAMQLGHAGRKVGTKAPWEGFSPLTEEDAARGEAPWQGLSSSPIAFKPGSIVPREMTHEDIRRSIQQHVDAARRTRDAGFEILEIHAAHGYIIQQFLSPIVNHRGDEYGGSLENRMRYGLELVRAVRAVWDDRPLFMRVSCVDGNGGGWNLDDTLVFAGELKKAGVDLVDCSSGGINGPLTLSLVPRVPGYHIPFSERVRGEVGIPTMAPGLITTAQQAEGYLQAGQCDLIAMARELIWNPFWPVHAAKELGVPDYLASMPQTYAWWLRRREDVRELSLSAQAAAVASQA